MNRAGAKSEIRKYLGGTGVYPICSASVSVDDAADIRACGALSTKRVRANGADREQGVTQVYHLGVTEHHTGREVHHPAWCHYPRRS